MKAIEKLVSIALIAASVLALAACRVPNSLTEEPVSPAPSALPGAPAGPLFTVPPGFPQHAAPSPSPDPAPADGERSVTKTLYYLTDEGYLLPVTARIAWEDGIAKACLSRLIDGGGNSSALALSGLTAPIPAGTRLSLALSDGTATVDLVGMPQLESAGREKAVFAAIVNTLTQFPSISAVTVLIDGSGAPTVHGVRPPERSVSIALNAETEELPTSGSKKPVTLYFPNEQASHFIPVTRYIEGEGLYAAIAQLAGGTSLPWLRGCFPENTLVLGAAAENGVLTVNLSGDFLKIGENPALYSLAMQSVMLTAQPYAKIDEVRFTVNNVLFEPSAGE